MSSRTSFLKALRSPFLFLLLRTAFAMVLAGTYIFVLGKHLPVRIRGIQNVRLEQQIALAQVQATADLKNEAKVFSPLISKLEDLIPTDEQAFEVTNEMRQEVQNIFAGQGRVEVGHPVLSSTVSGLRAVPVTVEGEGNMQTFALLLKSLESLSTLVRITSTSLAAVNDVEDLSRIRVTAEFFLR